MRNNKGQFVKGFKHTQDQIEKISKKLTGVKKIYKNPEAHKQMMIEKNKKLGISLRNKKRPPFSIEWKRKISLNSARLSGKNHWNWKGGISNNPYPKEFNEELKIKIRQRDNFICCLCGRTEREELEELNRVLCVNHKNFNKNDCREENLNTLCLRCNVRINRERDYWINYFKIEK